MYNGKVTAAGEGQKRQVQGGSVVTLVYSVVICTQ